MSRKTRRLELALQKAILAGLPVLTYNIARELRVVPSLGEGKELYDRGLCRVKDMAELNELSPVVREGRLWGIRDDGLGSSPVEEVCGYGRSPVFDS